MVTQVSVHREEQDIHHKGTKDTKVRVLFFLVTFVPCMLPQEVLSSQRSYVSGGRWYGTLQKKVLRDSGGKVRAIAKDGTY
jgi:hypothetical protein